MTNQQVVKVTGGHNMANQQVVMATGCHNMTNQQVVMATGGHNMTNQQVVMATGDHNDQLSLPDEAIQYWLAFLFQPLTFGDGMRFCEQIKIHDCVPVTSVHT